MRRNLLLIVILLFSFFLSNSLFSEPAKKNSVAKKSAKTNKSGKTTDAFGKKMEKQMKQYQGKPTDGSAPGGLGTFIETILILSLFVLGIYGVFRFVQKKRGTTVAGETTIKVLSSISIGGSRMLQIVEVGSQLFFIGVADSAINLISEIKDKETVDWIRMEHSKGSAPGNEGFLEKLFTMLGKGGSQISSSENERKIDFLRKQKERLRKMKDKQ